MNLKLWLRLAVAVAVVALLAIPASAQTTSTTGAIEGRITDVNGAPITGAKVTATGGRAPISAVTNAQGQYLFSNLPPGTYEVRVEKQGFGTVVQKDVLVSINSRRAVPFVLTPGQTENVVVTADAPLIDPKATTIGGTFTVDKYVNYIPTGRNFADSFALAPGVVSGGGTGAGNYSISGSSGLENSYIVDGINITNTGYGGIGAYNIVYGSLGSGVTYEFLEEIQVKTGGIDAEYGQATGGVINTVVKAGTNSVSGSVAAYAVPKSMVSGFKRTSLSTGAIDQTSYSRQEFAGSVGGPIAKDKLFYFVAYNPVTEKTGNTIEALELPIADFPDLVQPNTLLPGETTFPAANLGTQEFERKSNNYAAKLTWYANPNHRIEVAAFGDPSRGPSGAQQQLSLANLNFRSLGGGQSRIGYGADNYSLKYDGVITPNFFINAQIGRHDGYFEETNTLEGNRVRDRRQQLAFLTGTASNGALWYYGGTGFVSNSTDVNDQIKLSATWILGNHELRGGVQYDKVEYTDDQAYSGNPVEFQISIDGDGDGAYTTGGPDCDAVTGQDCYLGIFSTSGTTIDRRSATNYRSVRARFYPTPPPTETDDLGIYISDNWAVTPRWNLRLGLRASQQEIKGSGGFSLPFSTGPNGTRVLVPKTYNASSYKFDWAIAPRLGVTWDISGDGRSKLYANLARYYERIPNDLAIRALSNEVGVSRYTWQDYDYNTFEPLDPLILDNANTATFFQGLSTTCIIGNPGVEGCEDFAGGKATKLPYVDEVVLGYQRELGKDFSLEIRGVYREQGRALEDVQFATLEGTQNYYYGTNYGYPSDPFPGFAAEPFGAYVLGNPGENTEGNFPDAIRTYKAIELIANKRFSDNWLFYGTYRYARLRGNYEGLFRNDNGQSDPNITSLFDFPDSPLMEGQFLEGALNTDRPHTMRLNASYAWQNGFTVGGTMNWLAGAPRTGLLAHPNYQNAGEIPGADPIYFWWGGGACDVANTGTTDEYLAANAAGDACSHFLYDYTKVKRGNLGRTPDEVTFDTHLQYNRKLKSGTLEFAVTIFNLLNDQGKTQFNDNIEATAGVPDPDFQSVILYQTPRTVRLMARYSF